MALTMNQKKYIPSFTEVIPVLIEVEGKSEVFHLLILFPFPYPDPNSRSEQIELVQQERGFHASFSILLNVEGGPGDAWGPDRSFPFAYMLTLPQCTIQQEDSFSF